MTIKMTVNLFGNEVVINTCAYCENDFATGENEVDSETWDWLMNLPDDYPLYCSGDCAANHAADLFDDMLDETKEMYKAVENGRLFGI